MSNLSIVIATPHNRNDVLEDQVRARLGKFQVVRLRGKGELSATTLARINPAFVFVPHWSWLIPAEVYERFECVMFHMTDLPYGRGGSPLQNLIQHGHKDTRLTAFKCTGELDAGPVYLRRPLSLAGSAEEILRRASALMEHMIVDIVERRPIPTAQVGDAVIFKRRVPAESNMASVHELNGVFDFVRMLDADGYPRAFLDIGALHLQFSKACLAEGSVKAQVEITIRRNVDD
jgi:methionyl-tRNA formyltransferase